MPSLVLIGPAVWPAIGYRQTNRQTNRQTYRLLLCRLTKPRERERERERGGGKIYFVAVWLLPYYKVTMTICSHIGDDVEGQIVRKTVKVVQSSASSAGFSPVYILYIAAAFYIHVK